MDPEYSTPSHERVRQQEPFHIPRKPSGMGREQVRSLPHVLQPALPYGEGFSHPRGAQSWDGTQPPTGFTVTNPRVPRDPYAYYPPSNTAAVHSAADRDPAPDAPVGDIINPVWRRHLIGWILAFFAVACYVVTVIFAWNASLGKDADTRLLFQDPSKTILVLQVLGTSTSSLLAELVICTCEMVPIKIIWILLMAR